MASSDVLGTSFAGVVDGCGLSLYGWVREWGCGVLCYARSGIEPARVRGSRFRGVRFHATPNPAAAVRRVFPPRASLRLRRKKYEIPTPCDEKWERFQVQQF